ncbi:MAG: hypothetical protein WAK40_06905 [Thermoplasmata archaeon]
MPTRRRDVELSVERPFGPSGDVARLTVHFDPGADADGPTTGELKSALDALLTDLDAVIGVPLAATPLGRPDRELSELVGTYRPRQRELVDVLLSDGEITPTEHALLLEHLPRAPRTVPPPPVSPVPEQAIATAPSAAEQSLPPARPVPELLRVFQIVSLKQAGAVRARRQISFAEYMALKRHFESADADGARAGAGR